jgi:hypothetical protein
MSNDSSLFATPEELWDALLSRQAELIRAAFASLDQTEQSAALAHLQRMASEAGWHPEQSESALAALAALAENRS